MRYLYFFKEVRHCEGQGIPALNGRRPTRLNFRVVCGLMVAHLIATSIVIGLSRADTFDEALFNQLSDNCAVLTQGQLSSGDPEILRIGSKLADICGFSCTSDGMGGVGSCVLGAGTDGSTGGSASQQTTIALILKRIRALREGDDGKETQTSRLLASGATTGNCQVRCRIF